MHVLFFTGQGDEVSCWVLSGGCKSVCMCVCEEESVTCGVLRGEGEKVCVWKGKNGAWNVKEKR